MNDDALRLRLEALNRGALPASVRVVRTAAGRPVAEATPPSRGAWRAGAAPPIPGLVRRGEAVTTEAGEHWRICLGVDEIWPGGEELVRRRGEALRAKPASDGEDREWWDGLPHEVVFLDLETCGLSGSAMFLAGVLRPVEGRLSVELLLARDYAEESAVLTSLWQRLAGAAAIVTFNGKSFDWPMVVDRSRRYRMSVARQPSPSGRGQGEGEADARRLPHPGPLPEGEEALRHVDLLHIARRRWRKELPDCKLQTLERHICGRLRTDDMPSSQIPAAYQQYVRTGFEREMDGILLHNAIDLVTMLDLAMRLAGPDQPRALPGG
jgi:hypothetical protein